MVRGQWLPGPKSPENLGSPGGSGVAEPHWQECLTLPVICGEAHITWFLTHHEVLLGRTWDGLAGRLSFALFSEEADGVDL